MLLLLDTRNDTHYTGATIVELVDSIPAGIACMDIFARRAFIYLKPDSVSFSAEYTQGELVGEIARRTVQVLCRDHGWQIFRSDIV